MSRDLTFDLSKTQYEFVVSKAHIVQLMGPMGEGKTVAGVAGAIAHAQRCGKDIRAALVRDTFQNIKTSTLPDMRDYLGSRLQTSDGGKKAVILSNPRVELDLFGIDDEASISKLQGPQYAMIWLEEPAPIYEKANAGLPKEVFKLAIARASRQRGTVIRVQITQNPADEEHWTSSLIDEPRVYAEFEDPVTGEISRIIKECFFIPPGENKYLSGLTRAATLAAFKGDEAKMDRYVHGKVASVHRGKKVTPAYTPAIHFSPDILSILPGEVMQWWDAWHHPSCITAQYNHAGQLVIHDVINGEGVGVKELIEEDLTRLFNSLKYRGKVHAWRTIGDPSMSTPDQSSVKTITSKVVEKAYKTRFEKGVMRWQTRKEPLNRCFKQFLNDGLPAVVLSRSAAPLHRALKGGWHYKTDNNGRVTGVLPVKNPHSHPGDAFSYGISILMPYDSRKAVQSIKKNQRKLANSYRTGAYRRPATGQIGMTG